MRILVMIWIAILSSSVNADFEYDHFISNLYNIKADGFDGKKQLDTEREKLKTIILKEPNNPWAWYALGILEWEYIGTLEHKNYYDQNGDVSSSSPINVDALTKQKNKSFDSYDKAYRAHVHGPTKLKTKMLLQLQQTARDIELKIDIHRTILKEESGVGGIFGPNNTKIEFRRGLVSSMIRAKKYEMALSELDKVEAEFPSDINHPEWREAFSELIKNKVTTW